jgi:hypothetical protein
LDIQITSKRGVWEAQPQPEDIERILANHQRLFAGWRCA